MKKREVIKIIFVVRSVKNGSMTKMIKLEISTENIAVEYERIFEVKFWDYVGDKFLEEKLNKMKGHVTKDVYFVIPVNCQNGDYYSERIVRLLIKDSPYTGFCIL